MEERKVEFNWELILQFTVNSPTTTRELMLILKLMVMLKLWLSKLRKISKIELSFCYNVSWEEELCKTWCSRVKKKDLILFLNWELLRNGKLLVVLRKKEILSKTIKKELWMESQKLSKPMLLLAPSTIFQKNSSDWSKREESLEWLD